MTKPNEAHQEIIQVADFFHELAHAAPDALKTGTSLDEAAKESGLALPPSLKHYVVLATPDGPPAGQRSVTVTYPSGPEPTRALLKKCVTVGTQKGPASGSITICVSCSLAKLSCTITISGTITVGLG